ncbi:MAG: maleylpyruvate isomerase N-terminal domain-containing protein [Cellulomonas sp.]|nr:maleylpyruvate isomerase N-terminal domain-containing protein [Cellulomonas sp.]MCR6648988.1 maleylpyruvate isomerase N-terminal domain-containing protein [Cellulomonas sp.]
MAPTRDEERNTMARTWDDDRLQDLMRAERSALADDLASLTADQWRRTTLCGQWDVEEVVAHLTAAASMNQWRWLRSMVGARFRPDVHNERRLAEHRGRTPRRRSSGSARSSPAPPRRPGTRPPTSARWWCTPRTSGTRWG